MPAPGQRYKELGDFATKAGNLLLIIDDRLNWPSLLARGIMDKEGFDARCKTFDITMRVDGYWCYCQARKLKLPSDPTPVVKASSPDTETSSLDHAHEALFLLITDAQQERAAIDEEFMPTAEQLTIAAPITPPDDPAKIPLTDTEQAILDALTSKGQNAKAVIRTIAGNGMIGIDASVLSRAYKSEPMKARGVRHKRGRGYFIIPPPI